MSRDAVALRTMTITAASRLTDSEPRSVERKIVTK